MYKSGITSFLSLLYQARDRRLSSSCPWPKLMSGVSPCYLRARALIPCQAHSHWLLSSGHLGSHLGIIQWKNELSRVVT